MKKIYKKQPNGQYVTGYFIRSSSVYGFLGFIVANLAFSFWSKDYPVWMTLIFILVFSFIALYLFNQSSDSSFNFKDKSLINGYLKKFILNNKKLKLEDFFGLEECRLAIIEKQYLYEFYEECILEIDRIIESKDNRTYDKSKAQDLRMLLSEVMNKFNNKVVKTKFS